MSTGSDAPNPFAPPAPGSDAEEVYENRGRFKPGDNEMPLASRKRRLAAKLLDMALFMAFWAPVAWYLGIYDGLFTDPATYRPPDTLTRWSILAYSVLVFVALNGYFLHTRGQSIGKLLLNVRIVNGSGDIPPLTRILSLRYLPTVLVGQIPAVGYFLGLLDPLFIFGAERRCLHDLLAGTYVVRVAPSEAPAQDAPS